VTAYRLPSPSGYGEVKEYGRSDHIAPLAFPGLNIPVEDILPGISARPFPVVKNKAGKYLKHSVKSLLEIICYGRAC
jgi:hypothetical protein